MQDINENDKATQPGIQQLNNMPGNSSKLQEVNQVVNNTAGEVQSSQLTFGNDDKNVSNCRDISSQKQPNQHDIQMHQDAIQGDNQPQNQLEGIEIDKPDHINDLEMNGDPNNQSPPFKSQLENNRMQIQSKTHEFSDSKNESFNQLRGIIQQSNGSQNANQIEEGSASQSFRQVRALNIDEKAAQKYIENNMHYRRARSSSNTAGIDYNNTPTGGKLTMRTRNQGRKPPGMEETIQQISSKQKMRSITEREEHLNTQQSQSNGNRSNSQSNMIDKEQVNESPAKDNQALMVTNCNSMVEEDKKVKKLTLNTFEDCQKIYKKMFWFNWDLKELSNSRHSPKEELSAAAFWFYMNTTYFPYEIIDLLTKSTFEQWVYPIEENLNVFRFKNNVGIQQDQLLNFKSQKIQYPSKFIDQLKEEIINQNADFQFNKFDNIDSIAEKQDEEDLLRYGHIDKLIGKRRKFFKFQQHFTHLKDRAVKHHFNEEETNAIQEEVKKIPKIEQENINQIEEGEQNQTMDDADQEIAIIKEKIEKNDFQKMLILAERDLEDIQKSNFDALKNLFTTVKSKFDDSYKIQKSDDNYTLKALYKGEDIGKPMHDFLSRIEPQYIQDLIDNQQWYMDNMNRYLLNVNYPCKFQTECLKEMELLQQRRNDQKYRKILDQMDQLDQIKQAANNGDQKAKDELKKKEIEIGMMKLNRIQRSQIAQDDALCAICGVGDFEDNDQIVFCFVCSMPVHQLCFGLEVIPDNDWICNNCATYKLERGLMIKCMLCPKRGGAMKPTNIFSSYEKFYEQKKINMTKKHGKKSLDKLAACRPELMVAMSNDKNEDLNDMTKVSVLKRIEPYNSLTELLIREEAYAKKSLADYDEAVQKIEDGQIQELSSQMKAIKRQEEIQLIFNKHEIQNYNIPEDYSNFIKRNEHLLEEEAPQTDTLYHWVHHSCAMWMKEPVVTPRTSVKMNKLDFQRFQQSCIICCKKGTNVGACVKCNKPECQVFFHVECAKRANYCMEIEKKGPNCPNRERVFKIYCESHRPFKILQVINEQNQKEIDDIMKFAKTIEKALDVQKRHFLKPQKVMTKEQKNRLFRQALNSKKQDLIQLKKESKLMNRPLKEKRFNKSSKNKKWTKNDIKILMSRVKEKYLDIMKMRINLVRIDPMIHEKKRYHKEMRRMLKQEEKRKKQENMLKLRGSMNSMTNNDRETALDIRLRNRMRNNEESTNYNIDLKSFEGGEQSEEHASVEMKQDENENENEEMIQDMIQEINEEEDIQVNDEENDGLLNDELIEELNQEFNDEMNDDMNDEVIQDIENASVPSNENSMDLDDVEGLKTDEKLLIDGQEEITEIKIESQNTIDQNPHNEDHNKITLNLQSGAEEQESYLNGLPKLKQIPDFFKTATPLTISELEWTVTLSRYDFPWNEISFNQFTAKDCYKMYCSQVIDPESFLKKVLGDKVLKYQRMMYNQINGLPLYDTMINMKMTKKSRHPGFNKQHVQSSKNQQSAFGSFGSFAGQKTNQVVPGAPQIHYGQNPTGSVQLINPYLYCKCKGLNTQEFMVCCEAGEEKCVNGGWLHPECTNDLKHLTQEEIDAIEVWYCEDCREKNSTSKPKQIRRSSQRESKVRNPMNQLPDRKRGLRQKSSLQPDNKVKHHPQQKKLFHSEVVTHPQPHQIQQSQTRKTRRHREKQFVVLKDHAPMKGNDQSDGQILYNMDSPDTHGRKTSLIISIDNQENLEKKKLAQEQADLQRKEFNVSLSVNQSRSESPSKQMNKMKVDQMAQMDKNLKKPQLIHQQRDLINSQNQGMISSQEATRHGYQRQASSPQTSMMKSGQHGYQNMDSNQISSQQQDSNNNADNVLNLIRLFNQQYQVNQAQQMQHQYQQNNHYGQQYQQQQHNNLQNQVFASLLQEMVGSNDDGQGRKSSGGNQFNRLNSMNPQSFLQQQNLQQMQQNNGYQSNQLQQAQGLQQQNVLNSHSPFQHNIQQHQQQTSSSHRLAQQLEQQQQMLQNELNGQQQQSQSHHMRQIYQQQLQQQLNQQQQQTQQMQRNTSIDFNHLQDLLNMMQQVNNNGQQKNQK